MANSVAASYPAQTVFSEQAQATRTYLFILRDSRTKALFPYTVSRNGQRVAMTGQLTLFLNPAEIEKTHPAKIFIHQTPNGVTVDRFGLGLPVWTLKGSTGWRARPAAANTVLGGGFLDGYLAFHAFSDLIETYETVNRQRAIAAATANLGGGPQAPLELVFRDEQDDDWWVIEPEGLPQKSRSTNRVRLIEYVFRFTGLRNLKTAVIGPPDPTGAALLGGPTRTQKTSDALTQTLSDLQSGATELQTQMQADPTGAAAAEQTIGAALATAAVEPPEAQTARLQAKAAADTADQEVSQWAAAHTPTAAQQAAIAGTQGAARQLVSDVAGGSASLLSQDAASLSHCLDSSVAAGVGDPAALGLAKSSLTSATGVLAAHAVTLAPEAASTFSLTGSLNRLISEGQGHASALTDFVNGGKSLSGSALQDLQSYTTKARNLMQGVSFALDARNFAAPLGASLRNTRTQLRGLTCALQSLLSFSQNLKQGLRQSMNDIDGLFATSGCAGTFPAIKDVSWSQT